MKHRRQILYTKAHLFFLVLLRVLIGWHFLYEGLSKIFNPKWTSYGYLMDAQGFLGNFFHALADNPTSLGVVDFLNPIGLTLVGLSLVLGIAARFGAIGGIFLLALYYLSHIPYIGAEYLFPSEGSYLWVDKNVIEICALCLLMTFPTSGIIGLDRLLNRYWKKN